MRNFTRLCFLMALAALLLPLTLSAQYLVSGSGDPDANGLYQQVGQHNGKPLYSNGEYVLFYRDCTTKWAIGSSVENHPYYSSNTDGDVPSNEGWHVGGKYTGEVHGTVMVARMNSMAFDKPAVVESRLNDGTFNDSIRILLNTNDDPFTGEIGDDFVADGKVTVSNLPAGLSISIIRKSDNMLVAYITGTATEHHISGNVHNLTLAFSNSAFTDGEAGEIAYSTHTALNVLFMEKYLAFGADESPEVNGEYFLAGMFNGRPFYVNTDSTYDFKYKGCEWGAQWALTDIFGGCPYYSTSVNQETLPGDGWYDDGGGDGDDDTLYVVPINGLHYSTLLLNEDTLDNGSVSDTLVITYIARENGNAFTGINGDDFVAGGKAVVTHLPEGLTASLLRVNDTTLVLKLNGQAVSHEFGDAVDNLTLALTDAAFNDADAEGVMNATVDNIHINFQLKIAVYDARFSPEANGVYEYSGMYNGKPMFTKGEYLIAYRGCDAKWILKQDDPDGCPLYSTAVDGNLPTVDAWSDGGEGGAGEDTIYVVGFNTLVLTGKSFFESPSDDGSIEKPLLVSLLDPTGTNRFAGAAFENLVTSGKVTFTNIPEGMEPVALQLNDTAVLLGISGNAVHHEFADNVTNIEVRFNDAAFTSGNAAEVFNHTFSGIGIYFNSKYEVMGATNEPLVNGTYVFAGVFNNRPYFIYDEYVLGFRMCSAHDWMIIDGGDPNNLEGGYCPIYRNDDDTEWPPVSGWDESGMVVYPHHSLYAGNRVFTESQLQNNTFDGNDTLVVAYFFPYTGSSFSGENGSDFITDEKVTISQLPDGLTASLIRTGDTTLAMTVRGHNLAGEDQIITLTFNDNAFTGTTAGSVIYADTLEIMLDCKNEFLVASTGGDFSTIQEALQSPLVSDGDILNLAGETFTESDLQINKELIIRGQGPGKTIIQAAELPNTAFYGIFRTNFNSNDHSSLFIENLTLRNGQSSYGGAVYAYYTNLYLNNCELVGNYAYYNGGAVYIEQGSLQCTNSTFTGNQTEYSTTSSYYGGGAIRVSSYGDWPASEIENCTFYGNTSLAHGGAIHSYTEMNISNSTFSGNSAYSGGAIHRYSYQLNLVNTLVANNTATNAGPDIYGSLNAYFSLIENISGVTITGSDNITGTDPGLMTLADNGGLTRTCAIDELSAAVDKGTNTGTPALDQRGIPVFNTTRDIGAYEYSEMPIIMVSEPEMKMEAAVGDTIETLYTVSAVNLTVPLNLRATGSMVLSLTAGAVTGVEELQLSPDVNGNVTATNIYVLASDNTAGINNDSIIHYATGADSVVIPVMFKALSRPSGDNGSLTITRNTSHDFTATDFFFADPDGGTIAGIVVVSRETDGDLEYNNMNVSDGEVCGTLSGLNFRPYADAYGKPYTTFTFRVMDGDGLTSKEVYTMTINVNYVPELQNAIPDGNATVGTPYSYMIPDNTFNDPDASVEPVYTATLADGSPLPAWLTLDANGAFNGTPVEAGTLTIKVTATDEDNASATDEFVLTIAAANALDEDPDKTVNVFPNPTDGLVNVTIPIAEGSMVMKVTNLTGETVMIRTLENASNPVDFSAFPAGVYLMKLSNGQQTLIRRIVVN